MSPIQSLGPLSLFQVIAQTLFGCHAEHAILELVNSVSNSFEYGQFILGICIMYFFKVLETQSYYIVHHTILLNKFNQWYKK